MIKLALIADIHSNYLNLQLALNRTKQLGINKFIFLGDYILDGFDNDKVLNTIKKLDATVIRGNKEDFYLGDFNPNWNKYLQFNNLAYTFKNMSKENLQYIRSLPIYSIETLEGIKICMSHGSPYSTRDKYNDNDYEKFDQLIDDFDCNIYLFAHTHVSFCTEYRDKYFINVGSIGMPLDGPTAKFGVLTIEDGKIKYQLEQLEYDYTILEKYYKESEYYKTVDTWAKLSLMNIKDGYNYTQDFIDKVYKVAKSLSLDVTEGIPNDLWINVYEKFIKEKGLNRYV